MATDDDSQVVDVSTTQNVDASAQEPVQEQKETVSENVEQVSDTAVDSSEIKSQRGQKRVEELARERNAYAEELRTLKDSGQAQPREVPAVDYIREIENFDLPLTGDYATDMQLVQERATQKALATIEAKMYSKERLSTDIRELERAYPELRNEESNPNYDPALTDKVVNLYRKASTGNPSLRLRDFVDGIMEVRTRAVSAGKEQSVREIMAQEQSSAVTPSSKSPIKTRDPKEMTLSELEQMVGYAE